MKTNKATLFRGAYGLSIALLLGLLAAPAAADYGAKGVTLFQHVHFKGRSETFYGDVASLRGTYIGNDEATSVVVPRGCQVTLFAQRDCRGRSVTLWHDVADLSRTRVGNDHVSSLSVKCDDRSYDRRGSDYPRYDDRRRRDDRWYGDDRRYDGGYEDTRYDRRGYDRRGRYIDRGVTVFAGGGFRGVSENLIYDDPDLRDNRIRQDTISSVVVAPGCRAILFEDVGYRGRSTVIVGEEANMRRTRVGNDRVSSIQVDCRRRW